MLNRPIARVSIALLILFLCHCGGNTNIKPSNGKPTPTVSTAKADAKLDANTALRINKLLAQAQQQTSPTRENLLLQAAELYLEQGELDKANNLVNKMVPAKLPDTTFVTYSYIAGLINLNNSEADAARRILTNGRLERQLNALEPQQETKLRDLRAQVFERTGLLDEAISERISLSALQTSTKANNANQDALWQTLMKIPLAELQTNAAKGAGGITQGWYSLAALSKNNTLSIEAQQAALNKWLSHWPNHPAQSNLPKDLSLLKSIISKQPHKLALLLPLQGRLTEAGEAVSDGFFAAYYQAFSNKHPAPSVRQYDTSKSATAAYQQAVADGAELIIGPLDKDDVNQISHLSSLPIPILSLNYLSTNDTLLATNNTLLATNGALPSAQPTASIPGFYQFGLAVEDEARQAARQGIHAGLSRAFIVINSQEWSERSAQAFNDEWLKLGGTIISKNIFITQDKFSEAVRNLMSIDESQIRMKLLQQQLATKFEFTPRCRADIDMIFMAVTPNQGRQIKPTFAFYYANNIPTYATSNIYSGNVDAATNEDLNGVLFNTLPWVFDDNNAEKIAITQNTKSSAVYSRLHALGADAFHLYARLAQLKQAPDMRLYGATGSLRLLADGRIEREQIWARFNNGLAEPIPVIVDGNTAPQGE